MPAKKPGLEKKVGAAWKRIQHKRRIAATRSELGHKENTLQTAVKAHLQEKQRRDKYMEMGRLEYAKASLMMMEDFKEQIGELGIEVGRLTKKLRRLERAKK